MIKFVTVGEIVIYAIFAWFFITQIILPLIKGRPFFPILRSPARQAEGKLASAIEERDVANIEAEAEAIRPSKEKPRAARPVRKKGK